MLQPLCPRDQNELAGRRCGVGNQTSLEVTDLTQLNQIQLKEKLHYCSFAIYSFNVHFFQFQCNNLRENQERAQQKLINLAVVDQYCMPEHLNSLFTYLLVHVILLWAFTMQYQHLVFLDLKSMQINICIFLNMQFSI